jgi:broad specificity phosphatase PhoE
MKKLHFVRLGQTDTNINGILSENIEAVLTEDGKAQAISAWKELKAKHQHIDLIVCSPHFSHSF